MRDIREWERESIVVDRILEWEKQAGKTKKGYNTSGVQKIIEALKQGA